MANPQSSLPGLTPAHLEVRYGDSLLVPSPLISYSQAITRSESEVRESSEETRVLTGVILTDELGYHLVADKQRELESAFSSDNLELTIRASASHPCLASGTYIVSGIFPRVDSIEIREDVQFNRLDYTVTLANTTAVSGLSGIVTDFTNTWEYVENDSACTVEISHAITAQGINTSPSGDNALQNARDRVNQFIGLNNAPSDYPFFVQPASGSDVGFWELTTNRSESIDVVNGAISISEQFILVSGIQPYYDERTAVFTLDSAGIATVTINGTINGLGRTNDGASSAAGRSDGGTGFIHALSGLENNIRPNFYSDAISIYNTYNGTSILVDNVQSLSLTQNPCNGTIGYSVSFTDDPSADLPSGIVEKSCSVQINEPVVVVAEQTAPFRALGSIFQRVCTTSPGSFQIQISARAEDTGDRVVDTNRAIEFAESEVARLQPNPADYNDIYLSSRNKTINDVARSITVSVVWTFAQDIATVPGDTDTISLGRIS